MAVDVDLQSEHNFFSAKTRDISAGGLFIETNVGFPIGTTIQVDMLVLKAKISLPAEVVWELLDADGGTEGVGVRFIDISPEDRMRIETFMGLRPALNVGLVDDDDGGEGGPPPLPG